MSADITLRPVTPALLGALTALHNRSLAHDGVLRVVVEDELADDLDDEHVVLATDTRVALLDGAPAGYAHTVHLSSDVGFERAYVFGTVEPDLRGRGAGTALLEWGIQRAAEQLRSSGNDLPKYLRVEAYDFIESAQRLFEQAGFTPARYFDELLRPLVDLPTPMAVDGIAIEPWPVDRDDELRQVRNASFADHWGSTPMSTEAWAQRTGGYGSRPDLSVVAIEQATGRVVGVCANARYPDDDELLGRSDGWIDDLGTLREWRGRGVASALIGASLRAFAADGLSHASITVDSDSPTGAARLYRALGFEPQLRSITWQLEVA